MNELQIFKNEEFGEVRSLIIDNEPYFVGKDVATALGYVKSRNAIATHVDAEDKKVAPIQGDVGGTQEMILINESGLYSLILSSKLPQAKKFKRWVTSEVLPAIRKTGGYNLPSDPRELLQLTIEAHENTAKRVDNIEREVNDLKDNAFLSPSEYNLVSTRINERVRHIINGYHLNPNRQQRSELYKAINREIKVITGIKARCQLRQKDLNTVLDFVNDWEPSKATLVVVEQLALNFEEGKTDE